MPAISGWRKRWPTRSSPSTPFRKSTAQTAIHGTAQGGTPPLRATRPGPVEWTVHARRVGLADRVDPGRGGWLLRRRPERADAEAGATDQRRPADAPGHPRPAGRTDAAASRAA